MFPVFAGREVAVAKIGEHAVILGASMSGLLAARVLSDCYRTVTVVERDQMPTNAAQRRGVPQGRHVHALWPRGLQILDELFSGFLTELVTDGGKVWDDGDSSSFTRRLAGTNSFDPESSRGLKR
jgi:2-polyprenyl-6-methoxyphenol hydroxylase-like FAD-dependent oxidoreductase